MDPLRIVIVGGGTAGWMTAAALSSVYDRTQCAVHLIESADIGTVGVGEATLPHIRGFNKRIGVDEPAMMRETQATFKLGIEFVDWARRGDSYIHPFGVYGVKIGGVGFHQHWVRLRQRGAVPPIEQYSLPIMMCRAARFAMPADDPTTIQSTFGVAFQFDATLYAQFLRRFAESRGASRTEGTVVSVQQHGENGDIESLTLASGETVTGDFFIDCSGFRGLLIEETLKTGYEEWTKWLPCDRAVAVPCERAGALFPYTRATAREAGWQWEIPLQHRTGNGYVYSSAFASADEAAEKLLSRLKGPALAEPRHLRFTAGRRRKTWNRNCVAIGLSGGFLEPLESTSIYLIQIAITKFIDDLPLRGRDPRVMDAYNRWIEMEFDRVRDFLILHYHATERDDAPLWNYVRTMNVPDSLVARIELFRRRGYVPGYKDGLFLEPSWLAVFLGQRIEPTGYDPLADALEPERVRSSMETLRDKIRLAASQMPAHEDFLRNYCRQDSLSLGAFG